MHSKYKVKNKFNEINIFVLLRVLHMLENYVDFYLLNHLVNLIKNIPFVFVLVMDFEKIYGCHLLKDLI